MKFKEWIEFACTGSSQQPRRYEEGQQKSILRWDLRDMICSWHLEGTYILLSAKENTNQKGKALR